MTADHSHVSAGARHKRPLAIALGLTSTYLVVEVIAGLVFNSLALLSDAGHMLTDVAGLGMALAAIQAAESVRDPSRTYGLYRLEILAALANSLLLFGVAGYVLYEAVQRFSDPPDVPGLPLLAVAAVGLLVNLISFRLLSRGQSESLNVRGAFLEVVSDALGSAGVLIAGVVLLTTGWPYVDPIVGAGIGLFILPRTWRLGRRALRILIEAAPEGMDIPELERRLSALSGVAGVHDLHVWTVTSGLQAASGHLSLDTGAKLEDVLDRAKALLEKEYEIEHVTLQCEPAGYRESEMEV